MAEIVLRHFMTHELICIGVVKSVHICIFEDRVFIFFFRYHLLFCDFDLIINMFGGVANKNYIQMW